MTLLYLTLVFNGVCFFYFFGRVCQYDLNEVRGFEYEIRWASLFGGLHPGDFVGQLTFNSESSILIQSKIVSNKLAYTRLCSKCI